MSQIIYDRKSCRGVSPSYRLVHLCVVLGLAATGCAESTAAPGSPAGAAAMDEREPAAYWPIALVSNEGQVEVYQPQPEAMNGDMLSARAAVSLTRAGAAAPVFGAAWFTARVAIDRDTRTVIIREVTVKDVRLPGSTATEQKDFAGAIGARLSTAEATFPLDQLTASLDTARREQIEATHLATSPPRILFSTTPATLISVNGPPRLQPVEGRPGVSRVANTPFILLWQDADRHYYLKAGTRWVSAPDLTGLWANVAAVPPAIAATGADLDAPTTQPSAVAGLQPADAPAAPKAVEIAPGAADATIIVVTNPAELIVTDGIPQFTPVPGGAGGTLLYASNTASDLFLDQSDHRYYVLLSGRWYAAESLQGRWAYIASDRLPREFALIPSDSPKAEVLSFIAGTTAAHEAVLDAGVPQTASVRHDAGADLSVAYDGDPRFQEVPESPGVSYALNTPEDVLRVNGRFYSCHQAVWYESAGATGPWAVCVAVPPVIYTLPPSCPLYHVRYVYVYDHSADYVTCGYLPGYTGTYVYGPTIVYGTGYTYPGWYGTTYFAPPCTWGYSAYYDPFAFTWGFDVGLFWGRGGWFCHPFHERWWRDHPGERWGWHCWWGPGGFVHARDIRGHFDDARRGGAFRDGRRDGSLTARMPAGDHRGPGWNNLYARDGNARRNIPAAQRRASTPARVSSGTRDNVFAGSDGHVYRRSDSGWEEHRPAGAGRAWSGIDRVPDAHPTYRPAPGQIRSHAFAPPNAGLDQHFMARSNGAVRSAPARSLGGGGETRGGVGGSRGGGGGGSRGGGARR